MARPSNLDLKTPFLALAMVFFWLLFHAAALPQDKLTPAEDFVRRQAAKGEWANFFPGEVYNRITPSKGFRDVIRLGSIKIYQSDHDRTLSARFLQDLLTGSYRVHRKGIWISNALINEPLDLQHAHIKPTVVLENSRFLGEVNCQDAIFEQHVNISGSHFEKKAHFQRLTAKIHFICQDAIFRSGIDLVGANIGGQLQAQNAEFFGEKDGANFESLKIGDSAFFDGATFEGPVNFAHANIGTIFLVNSRFLGEVNGSDAVIKKHFNTNGAHFDKKANFQRLTAKIHFICEGAIFQDGVDLAGADIGGQLLARNAQFCGRQEQSNFNGIKVGQGAFFPYATFQGQVNFAKAKIGMQFCADSAKFLSRGQEVTFYGMEVQGEASFNLAIFRGMVDFKHADIGSDFSAEEAWFLHEKAIFHSEPDFRLATGRDPLGLQNADTDLHLYPNGTWVLRQEAFADFEGLKVGRNASFRQTVFQGPVNFGRADIGGQFWAHRAEFRHEAGEANFNAMQVGGSALFDNAVFHGPVDFVGADIGGQFRAEKAQFLGGEKFAEGESLLVNANFLWDSAVRKGLLPVIRTGIDGPLPPQKGNSRRKEAPANFASMKVGHDAVFDHATFLGPVNYYQAHIAQDFRAKNAWFLYTKSIFSPPENKTSFNNFKVGGSAIFDGSVFQGPVDFIGANIGGQFHANSTRFLYASRDPRDPFTVSFDGMRVGREAYFNDVIFQGIVIMAYGNYLDLQITGSDRARHEDIQLFVAGSTKPAEEKLKLSLYGTTVHKELITANLDLAAFNAAFLQVKGQSVFERLTFLEPPGGRPDPAPEKTSDAQETGVADPDSPAADFFHAALGTLIFQDVQWPRKAAGVRLDGLTYVLISVQWPLERFWNELYPDDFVRVRWLLYKSAFNPQNYLQLEEYLNRVGRKNLADWAYIAMKDRELAQLSVLNPMRWLEWLFWGWLTGYGRKPSWTLLISCVIVVLGAFFYDPRKLDPAKKKAWHVTYPGIRRRWWKSVFMRVLISLDQFIPAINLKVAENWLSPNFRAWFWFKLQAISGWILVPIGLVAIFSQLK